jgi:3-hydroxyisobutyryl-CoA hydrolase
MLLDRLAELNQPHPSLVDRTIEEFSLEREAAELPAPFIGKKRIALDHAFRHNTVEEIIVELETFSRSEDAEVASWAGNTLEMLHLRSPTSLKVALKAIRLGANMTLREALDMELGIATAFCVSFFSGSCNRPV